MIRSRRSSDVLPMTGQVGKFIRQIGTPLATRLRKFPTHSGTSPRSFMRLIASMACWTPFDAAC